MVKVRKKRVRKGEKLAGVGCAAVDRRGENVKKKEKWRERVGEKILKKN
jgi:hypothetical protein